MKNMFGLLVVLLTIAQGVQAGSLDDIRQALEASSVSQVQEKVYIHTDNQCYFVGDTLWYKAYVVRADNLHPTDMSRILYVELLSPDGVLVERQRAYGRRLCEGAAAYACECPDLSLGMMEWRDLDDSRKLSGYDAFIVRVLDDRMDRIGDPSFSMNPSI